MKRPDRRNHQEAPAHPIVIFDGTCNLCNCLVEFIIKRDPSGRFRFAPAQTDMAREAFQHIDGTRLTPESIILIDENKVFVKSKAVLRIAAGLSGGWRTMVIFRIIPRRIRDFLYDIIAANRYHWLGRRAACPTPDKNTRGRIS